MWNNQFKLVMNALATDCRRSSASMTVPLRHSPLSPSPFPCYFCGTGEDTVRHMYTNECPVTRESRLMLGGAVGITIVGTLRHSLLAFPPTNPIITLATYSLNYSIWYMRSHYFSSLNYTPNTHSAASRIFEHALNHFPSRRRRSTPESVLKLISEPREGLLLIFSDGSAMPNPGPCGAGIYFQIFSHGKVMTGSVALALGHGTNNIGEFNGILLAITIGDSVAEALPLLVSSVACLSDCLI